MKRLVFSKKKDDNAATSSMVCPTTSQPLPTKAKNVTNHGPNVGPNVTKTDKVES
jgi:hypothetical protein